MEGHTYFKHNTDFRLRRYAAGDISVLGVGLVVHSEWINNGNLAVMVGSVIQRVLSGVRVWDPGK